MTVKGQVTIPVALRERLGLRPGDKVRFDEEGGRILLTPLDSRVESVFGLVKARKSASLEDMDAAIAAARGRRARR
jgi:AbrB family looped-hinge helix DNA binding protein